MSPPADHRPQTDTHLLLAYIADLELEVDRLRRQGRFIHHEANEAVARFRLAPGCEAEADRLAAVLGDFQESPGYHPAHDQVVAIAVRPLAEQTFRWQHRLAGSPAVELRLELAREHVDWFPARLRHVLDNLFASCLQRRDPGRPDAWVCLALAATEDGYRFRLTDNGRGVSAAESGRAFDLFRRAAPVRAAGLGVGLSVARMLVERSGGTADVADNAGGGAVFTLTLPRYDLDDWLL